MAPIIKHQSGTVIGISRGVRYDYPMFKGDYNEEAGGHGTMVAAIIAGQLESGIDDAKNGVAVGVKLHIYDIQRGARCE